MLHVARDLALLERFGAVGLGKTLARGQGSTDRNRNRARVNPREYCYIFHILYKLTIIPMCLIVCSYPMER